MTSQRLSGTCARRSGPRHPWTQDQRLYLYILNTEFQWTRSQRTKLFNFTFRDGIDSTIFPSGLASAQLSAQYGERQKESNASWAAIMRQVASDEESGKRKQTAKRIEQAAVSLGIGRDLHVVDATTPVRQTRLSSEKKKRTSADSELDSVRNDNRLSTAYRRITGTPRGYPVVVVRRSTQEPEIGITATDVSVAPLSPPSCKITPAPFTTPRTVKFRRRKGTDLDLPVEKYQKIPPKYTPPSELSTHPHMSPLLFRFWHDKSHGYNSENGFIASRYDESNVVWSSPPKARQLDPTDLFNHLNGNEKSSPFISVSNFFPWCLRNALKQAKKGNMSVKVSVLEAAKFEHASAIFYAAPFCQELKKFYAFSDGAQKYYSSHEFLVWHEVRRDAILHTFTLEDLLNQVGRSPGIAHVLRLDTLLMPGDYRAKVHRLLRDDDVKITPVVATAVAHVCQFVGLRHTSNKALISHMVADTVKGFSLRVQYRTPEHLQSLASAFAHAFIMNSDQPVPIKDQQEMKLAFLYGVSLGLGDFNVTHSANRMQKMQRAATAVGLENPARIICDEMDAIKIHLWTSQKQHGRLVSGAPSQTLLNDELDGASEDAAEGGAEDDVASVFQMDEDGIVL